MYCRDHTKVKVPWVIALRCHHTIQHWIRRQWEFFQIIGCERVKATETTYPCPCPLFHLRTKLLSLSQHQPRSEVSTQNLTYQHRAKSIYLFVHMDGLLCHQLPSCRLILRALLKRGRAHWITVQPVSPSVAAILTPGACYPTTIGFDVKLRDRIGRST